MEQFAITIRRGLKVKMALKQAKLSCPSALQVNSMSMLWRGGVMQGHSTWYIWHVLCHRHTTQFTSWTYIEEFSLMLVHSVLQAGGREGTSSFSTTPLLAAERVTEWGVFPFFSGCTCPEYMEPEKRDKKPYCPSFHWQKWGGKESKSTFYLPCSAEYCLRWVFPLYVWLWVKLHAAV